MKIEKVNDNQIRCTLTKEDLDDRQLKISEIAYGSEKAKLLFRDMMQQANYEYGFEAEDIPLMIEAIPMSSGCIVFIITKVEDPEELDTRFSKFAPSVHESDDYYDDDDSEFHDTLFDDENIPFSSSGDTLDNPNTAYDKSFDEVLSEATDANNHLSHREQNQFSHENVENNKDLSNFAKESLNEVFDLFRKISGTKNNNSSGSTNSGNKTVKNTTAAKPSSKTPDGKTAASAVRLFSFGSLDDLTSVAHVIDPHFTGSSALYKNTNNHRYYLLLVRSDDDTKGFMRICNLLMEYGTPESCTPASIAYMDEHYTEILLNHAIHSLAQI